MSSDRDGERPASAAGPTSTALLTDQYELTMLRAALRSGVAQRRAVFEVFARHLPHGRRYGVVAGAGRLLDALARFRFGPEQLGFLADAGVADEETLRYLEAYAFSGDIWGYAEGDCYFPGSPILVVEAPFAEAVVLETLVLSILNHDCAIASAASRMVTAAGDRPLIEMGSRRTHELAAVASARAAYIAGFDFTSNLRAGHDYGVPTSGTAAHAFTLAHDTERDAFRAQIDALGPGTTLLVDTYDVEQQGRTHAERGKLRLERSTLAGVGEDEGVGGRPCRRDRVPPPGFEVRGRGEADDPGGAGGRDGGLLVRPPTAHLDEGPTAGGDDHPRRRRGDGAVVVEHGQHQRLEQQRFAEGGLHGQHGCVREVQLAVGEARHLAREPEPAEPRKGLLAQHPQFRQEVDLLVAEPEVLDQRHEPTGPGDDAVATPGREAAGEHLEHGAVTGDPRAQGAVEHRQLVEIGEQGGAHGAVGRGRVVKAGGDTGR